ncbi:hypothetical protein BDN72DRAFT_848377 [Pluteus cervinus]|uniref:Uncharacterized protein n=1 Tax=Pluteus cervinus TaxID=181527 RepID=A0ACD3AAL8_9AGAR|nr:hypothetical protein BDN72DRAFT_848377 [Pluteus cervinus]
MDDLDALTSPTTPHTPLTSSLHIATSNVDDLTAAITNFSRVPSPEPTGTLACCCGKVDCENLLSWLHLKSRLESRLILSAEVGQALLQRHEAYVRKHEGHNKPLHGHSRLSIQTNADEEDSEEASKRQEELDTELSELYQENHNLKKQLNQALVNNEVTEVSSKTILQELQEAKTTISRLTAHHARSVGWDSRLHAAMKEKDDMQQERDSESQRARLAESRFAALRDKTAKLQVEVRRLQEALEEKRSHRLESSESLLSDVRARLEGWQTLMGPHTSADQEAELTRVLQSLVDDNETLKHDNAELQHFLSEAREELHALQEEVDEQRANLPSHISGNRSPSLRHAHTNSVPSITFHKDTTWTFAGRSPNLDKPRRRAVEPLTPETNQRSLTPVDPYTSSESRLSSSQDHSRTSSQIGFEVEADDRRDNDVSSSSPEQMRTHKTLLLLTRSRGVQTDPTTRQLSPSPYPTHISTPSPHDPRSESSSFSDALSSHITTVLDRANSLLGRMTQADPFTLTNRLKRQNLKGADVGHLSRTTIASINTDLTNLRAQYRFLLEDDKLLINCSRKDFRLLFKFLRDVFVELGQLRGTLNDIILDPSIAPKISERALDPKKAEAHKEGKEHNLASWMAPISKLFGTPSGRSDSPPTERIIETPRPAPKLAPKRAPALSAYATTVNVEFSGVGRSTTSTFATSLRKRDEPPPPQQASAGLMDIFAGAPKLSGNDPWVVVAGPSKAFHRPHPTLVVDTSNPSTIGRSFTRSGALQRLSRNVDAMIDSPGPIMRREEEEAPDTIAPLIERGLRRRGLSDSSIHSSFVSHGGDDPLSPTPQGGSGHQSGGATSQPSVFGALSQTMMNFKLTGALGGASSGSGSEVKSSGASTPSGAANATTVFTNNSTPTASPPSSNSHSRSPSQPSETGANSSEHRTSIPTVGSSSTIKPRTISRGSGMRAIAPARTESWASSAALDSDSMAAAGDKFVVGSVRHESSMRWPSSPTVHRGHESYTRDFV